MGKDWMIILPALYDPASPDYRHYLTPQQFTDRFGPTEQDYQAVVDFAKKHGLTIVATHSNRLLLDVNGSVADIQKAFHVTMRVYRHPTQSRDFYAPDVEPTVDASLPIADVSGLNNYTRPHPNSLKMDSEPAGVPATPRTGSGSGGAYQGSDFRAAYLPGVALTGSGQMVGLLEFDGYYASDISAYESAAGLPPVPLQTVLLDGFNGVPTTGVNSGNGEVSLDIEMTVSMAPGLAGVVVFEAGQNAQPNDILNAMAARNQISQLSCSWGWGGGPSTTTDNIFKQMAAQGQSFFNASGDNDAFTTGANSVNGVDNPSLGNAPSSSPFITVVGGTTLATSGPGGAWSSETAWNWRLRSGSYVGSSGGISSFYSIPNWQASVSMSANGGSATMRNIPDVALAADNIHVLYGNGTSDTFGGTSCAAPLWAGLAALMNEQAGSAGRPTVGFINPATYAIGNGAGYSAGFHDITSGDNTRPSSAGKFYAVTGYDLCTGWGTPAGQELINAIAGLPDSLRISPAAGVSITGTPGGPFNVTSATFQLNNISAAPVAWSLSVTSAWLQVSSTGGTLAAGSSTAVTASLTSAANDLPAGTYVASLIFTDGTSHIVQNVPFTLNVAQSLMQNGGFETGDFTGWTLFGNSIISDLQGTTVYDAAQSLTDYPSVVHSGSYGAFLGDIQLATLSQTLPTVPGENYLLSLWLDNPTNGTLQQFDITWNGLNLYHIVNPAAFSWTNLQFIVTASSANAVLQFGAENDPAEFGVDDVSVTRVPPISLKAIGQSAGNLDVAWTAAAGLVYQVQYKTNLLQADWLNLSKPILATNNEVRISDSSASPQRFYRLVLVP